MSLRFLFPKHLTAFEVKIDQGISFEMTLEDFKDELSASQEGIIQTGFYIQKIWRQDGTSKVCLIINPGRSDKCVVVRPNLGRRVMTKRHVSNKIRYQDYIPIDQSEARTLWSQEFEKANRPSSESV